MESVEAEWKTRSHLDIRTLRDRALQDMAEGPVTPAYKADVLAVISVLNTMLASAIVCWLRYQQHATVAAGINATEVARCFASNAADELHNTVTLALRINQLGGIPDLDPVSLASRAYTAYHTYIGTELSLMLKENLIASRIVIQISQEMIRWIGADDPTTRRLLESILEREESHASELRNLLGAPG